METEIPESQGSVSLFVLNQDIVVSSSRSVFPRTGVVSAALCLDREEIVQFSTA